VDLESALATGLDDAVSSEAIRLATYLAELFGPSTAGVIHYGSHAQGIPTRAESAWDFFVIVDEYAAAYRCLRDRLGPRIAAGTAARLNRILPPNVIGIPAPASDRRREAKCAVLSVPDLERACSRKPRDHFVRGRLFQRVQLAWARDAGARGAIVRAIEASRLASFEWVRSYLPPRFDPERYCRTMLETSYAGEIRPEAMDHVGVLLRVQESMLLPTYGALLEHLAGAGVLAREAGSYLDPRPPGAFARFRSRAFFAVSKTRATLRWLKYVALYDDWLEYVLKKLEHRSGVAIRLTPLERRWPLLFLWPRALRFVFTRPQRRR